MLPRSPERKLKNSEETTVEREPQAHSPPAEGPTDTAQIGAMNALRLSPPTMCTDDLPSYFWALEHWFAATGITPAMDSRRFHIVAAQIPVRSLPELRPLLEPLPAANKYTFAKETIIRHFEESQRSRLQRLLSGMELGDRKPSQLLAEMRRAAGDAIAEPMLTDLWITRLPPHVQSAVIAARGTTTDKIGVADAVMDAVAIGSRTFTHHSLAEVKLGDVERIAREVAELSRKFGEFVAGSRQRNKSRQRSHPRQQTPTRDHPGDRECYYHRRFGTEARRCLPPCSFATASGQQSKPPSS